MGGTAFLVAIIFAIVIIFPYVRIIQKAGYSGWWVLVGVVPIVNIIMIYVFALSEWPALRDKKTA